MTTTVSCFSRLRRAFSSFYPRPRYKQQQQVAARAPRIEVKSRGRAALTTCLLFTCVRRDNVLFFFFSLCNSRSILFTFIILLLVHFPFSITGATISLRCLYSEMTFYCARFSLRSWPECLPTRRVAYPYCSQSLFRDCVHCAFCKPARIALVKPSHTS